MSLPWYVGCATWGISKAHQPAFPVEGTHLSRYAARLPAMEINSSFHRPHRVPTYERWAASVPPDFRFAVKIPKTITHEHRLVATDDLLDAFLAQVAGLGAKLGCLLVQLPPSLAYDAAVMAAFFTGLCSRYNGAVVIEPRHASWFTREVDEQLRAHRVARVAADPARVPGAGEPGGWPDVVYFRLHGSPRIYFSSYDDSYLDELAERLRDAAAVATSIWCIFDNTTLGAATGNALGLLERLG